MTPRIIMSDNTIILYDVVLKDLQDECLILKKDGFHDIEGAELIFQDYGYKSSMYYQVLSKNKSFPIPPSSIIKSLIANDLNPDQ